MSSFEKSVKGATKIKLAPPKAKYIEHILQATRLGENGVAEVFRPLQYRLRDTTWTTAFKSLIVVHLMIREGGPNNTIGYLSAQPRQILGGPLHTYADVQTQGRNIRHYTLYLIERAKSFQKARVDYVVAGEGRMKELTVDKGLLRETEAVQEQIQALLKCDLLSEEPENEISLTAFRLLTMDLLALYPVMNEGAINVLEHFFEMSKPDAERGLFIYKRFAKQTDLVVRFLSVAKQHEQSTRLEVPKLRHAPLSLATSLEEYLNDVDFETNRRQYIGLQSSKKNGTNSSAEGPFSDSKVSNPRVTANQSFPEPGETRARNQPPQLPQITKRLAPDLMDFFGSIDQSPPPPTQQPTTYQQQAAAFTNFPNPTSYGGQSSVQQQSVPVAQYSASPPHQTNNPYGQIQQQQQQQQQQMQPQFTGAGFGGYGPQPTQQPQYQQFVPQQVAASTGFDTFNQTQQSQQQVQQQFQVQNEPPQQQHNPFRQASSPTSAELPSANPWGFTPQQPQPTGAPNLSQPSIPMSSPTMFNLSQPQQQLYPNQTGTNPFSQQAYSAQQQQQPLAPQQTGTNPFTRTTMSQPPTANAPASPITANPTGSTNPFRQSAFVNQATGQGWQHGPQGTLGGLERLETVPVFPRPGQAQQNQQGQQGQWL